MMKSNTDIFYKSHDGLELYARDYGKASARHTLLCMHGLTRNSKDFHNLALLYQDKFRVISVDQRGRGKSQYDSYSDNYRPDIYCQDMFSLIKHLGLDNIIAIGTSMGGMMAMMMAAMRPGMFKGVILNDIGPVVEPAGLKRIQGYVGGLGPFKNWYEAQQSLRAQGPTVFPKYTNTDWEQFAKRTCELREDGLIHFAYDTAIAKAVKMENTNAVPSDLWQIYSTLGETPVVTLRGEISDILSLHTLEKMQSCLPNCQTAIIPDVGHVPTLDEPDSLAAIDAFLGQFNDK